MKNGSTIKNFFINASFVVLSVGISAIVAEGICRILYDPLNYLEVELIADDVLGHRVKPGSAGHDAWGYRNMCVPATAHIVAIGDSQTYGVSAVASNSWPAILERLTGTGVYNLSSGGYGPVQYVYLLEHQAIKLDPSFVIVGFYFGNDLFDAYRRAYKSDYWKHLQRKDFFLDDYFPPQEVVLETEEDLRRFWHVRGWLARHSILYRIVTSSFLGDIARRFEMTAISRTKENYTNIQDKTHNVFTAFRPDRRLRALNLKDPKIQEGLRISLECFATMNELCSDEDIHFLVVLIPTKESVFQEYIEHNQSLNNHAIVDELLVDERKANAIVKKYFDEHAVSYIDVLPELKSVIGNEKIYRSHHDGHPNKRGYRIIADRVYDYLKVCAKEKIFSMQ